jgi:hypothetical protein
MTGRSKHLTAAALIFSIGLLVFCCATLALASGQLRPNWFIYLVFGIVGAYVSAASGRVLFSARKRPKCEGVFSISLPNSVSLVAPCEMRGGTAVIYLPGSAKLYRGEITLFLKQKDTRLEFARVFLSGMKPLFRIPVPTWLKWLHVQEAGTRLSFWPRGAIRSSDPVIVSFAQSISQGDTIELSIDVTSILDEEVGAKLRNVRTADAVTVCFNT